MDIPSSTTLPTPNTNTILEVRKVLLWLGWYAVITLLIFVLASFFFYLHSVIFIFSSIALTIPTAFILFLFAGLALPDRPRTTQKILRAFLIFLIFSWFLQFALPTVLGGTPFLRLLGIGDALLLIIPILISIYLTKKILGYISTVLRGENSLIHLSARRMFLFFFLPYIILGLISIPLAFGFMGD